SPPVAVSYASPVNDCPEKKAWPLSSSSSSVCGKATPASTTSFQMAAAAAASFCSYGLIAVCMANSLPLFSIGFIVPHLPRLRKRQAACAAGGRQPTREPVIPVLYLRREMVIINTGHIIQKK